MLNNQPTEPRAAGDGTSLDVHSIFHTIQGEGPFSGRSAVFIRLAGCNLQCPMCFGWRGNLRQPHMYMANGSKRKMSEVAVGEKILTLDNDGNIAETEVKNVMAREVNEWIEIQVEDRGQYAVTPEHPFFTNRGMIPASELVEGDEILHCEPNDVIRWKKLGSLNPMKDPAVAARKAESTDYVTMGKKVAAVIKNRKQSGLHWGGPMSDAGKLAISIANSGKNNGNANDQTPENFLALRREINQDLHVCASRECDTPESRLEVHHVDNNRSNDAPENLVVLCHACHSKHHMRGYNFWTRDERVDNKSSDTARDVHNGLKILKIKRNAHDPIRAKKWPSSPGPAPLPVTNFSCYPHNTYLADNMWVHNCDTEYTQGRADMRVDEILDSVKMSTLGQYCKLIVITGGEPFRQNIAPLCSDLITAGYMIQVETNGKLKPQNAEWLQEHITDKDLVIVCSPKTPTVSEWVQNWAYAFKYVVDADSVDPDDMLPIHALEFATGDRVARPKTCNQVYVSPMDHNDGDPIKMQNNVNICVAGVMKHGYTVSLQTHKIMGLE